MLAQDVNSELRLRTSTNVKSSKCALADYKTFDSKVSNFQILSDSRGTLECPMFKRDVQIHRRLFGLSILSLTEKSLSLRVSPSSAATFIRFKASADSRPCKLIKFERYL